MALRTCMFVGLFCSNHVVAMRKDFPHDLLDQEEVMLAPAGVGRQEESDAPLTEKQARIARIDCAEMPTAFAQCLEDAEEVLRQNCRDGRCHLTTAAMETVDRLEEVAECISDHVGAADARTCLAQTLDDDMVQERTARLLLLWTEFLAGASSRERLDRSAAIIGNWRERMLAGAGSIIDQSLVFPSNVEDPDVCPEPCLRCTQEHNSIFEGEERLSFKCILPRGGSAPSSADFSCSEPVRRSGPAGLFEGQSKTWCDVQSWRVSTQQGHSLQANVTCGVQAILGPLRHGIEMEERVRNVCLAVESGEHVESYATQEYSEYSQITAFGDGSVADGEVNAFRIFMEMEMAEGLAALRRAARGNTAQSLK